MKTCKTCKCWTPPEVSSPWDVSKGGACACPKFVYHEPMPRDGLEYYDAEGYAAGFYTGPDFGCIHHEAKA